MKSPVYQFEQCVRVVRLREEISRSHHLGNFVKSNDTGSQDDRNLLAAAVADKHLVGHFRTGKDRHLHIENHEIGPLFGHGFHALTSVGRLPHAVPGRLNQHRNQASDIVVVVNNEDIGHIMLVQLRYQGVYATLRRFFLVFWSETRMDRLRIKTMAASVTGRGTGTLWLRVILIPTNTSMAPSP